MRVFCFSISQHPLESVCPKWVEGTVFYATDARHDKLGQLSQKDFPSVEYAKAEPIPNDCVTASIATPEGDYTYWRTLGQWFPPEQQKT